MAVIVTQKNYLTIFKDKRVKRFLAYKVVDHQGYGPVYGSVQYVIGKIVRAKATKDPAKTCARGINVATKKWCFNNYSWELRSHYYDRHQLLLVEFSRKDFCVVPTRSDGKFRVHCCKVVERVKVNKRPRD